MCAMRACVIMSSDSPEIDLYHTIWTSLLYPLGKTETIKQKIEEQMKVSVYHESMYTRKHMQLCFLFNHMWNIEHRHTHVFKHNFSSISARRGSQRIAKLTHVDAQHLVNIWVEDRLGHWDATWWLIPLISQFFEWSKPIHTFPTNITGFFLAPYDSWEESSNRYNWIIIL